MFCSRLDWAQVEIFIRRQSNTVAINFFSAPTLSTRVAHAHEQGFSLDKGWQGWGTALGALGDALGIYIEQSFEEKGGRGNTKEEASRHGHGDR